MPNFDENIGFWDSVLIENLTEESFIANLYQRYRKGLIYVRRTAMNLTFVVCDNWFEYLSSFPDADIYWRISGGHKSISSTAYLLARRCSNVCNIELLQITSSYVSSINTRPRPLKLRIMNEFVVEPFFVVVCSFGLSNLAYQNLQDQNEHQCVCVLGESNAGKTETARMVAHFVSHVSKTRPTRVRKPSDNVNLLRCKSLADCPKQSVNGIGSTCPKVCISHAAIHQNQLNMLICLLINSTEKDRRQICRIRSDASIQKPGEHSECGCSGDSGSLSQKR